MEVGDEDLGGVGEVVGWCRVSFIPVLTGGLEFAYHVLDYTVVTVGLRLKGVRVYYRLPFEGTTGDQDLSFFSWGPCESPG